MTTTTTTTTTTTSTSSAPTTTTTTYWALDSNQNELDPKLKAAQELAFQEHLEFVSNNGHDHEQKDDQNDQIQEPLILRNLLSGEQIDQILTKASAFGVWPRGGIGKHSKQQCEEKDNHNNVGIELCSVPHHYAWTQDHVVLYMHNKEPNWFVDALPSLWCIIRGAMESRPSSWMDDGDGADGGVFPVLDEAWVGSEQSMKRVRCIELHHYSTGGGLLIPGHRDTGSDLTISILLSDPKDDNDENDNDNNNNNNGVSGGDFVTYKDGIPVAHKMNRGDAILFNSEDLHNISTVTSGVRQSLVVELYPSYPDGGYY
eukprot:scaffold814_cov100-Cylindrotheca_fusiformis.AAC.4